MSLISYERERRPLTKKKKLFKDSNRVIEYETLLFAYSSWLHSYNETKV